MPVLPHRTTAGGTAEHYRRKSSDNSQFQLDGKCLVSLTSDLTYSLSAECRGHFPWHPSVNTDGRCNCPPADNLSLKSEFGTLVLLLYKEDSLHTEMPVICILLVCSSTSHPRYPAFINFCIFRAADKTLAETEPVWVACSFWFGLLPLEVQWVFSGVK